MDFTSLAMLSSRKLWHICFILNLADSPSAGIVKRDIDCNATILGLLFDDCQYMSSIEMAGVGINAAESNGNIWIGEDGPNTFTFTNNADPPAPVTLVMWDNPEGDFGSSFMNDRIPKITYSLEAAGDSVTISLENGVSGGWSGLYNRMTTLSAYGQIYNTWGEFTTGDYATVDVSREVNMSGNTMSVSVETGCKADMDNCSFQCKDGANECGDPGTYDLLNCSPDTNPNAATGTVDGVNPEGGCMGWDNGGHLDIEFS